MSRSSKKGPFIDEKLMKKVNSMIKSEKRTPIKTWARRSSITPEMVGLTIEVHNGKIFLPLRLSHSYLPTLLVRDMLLLLIFHSQGLWEVIS